MATTAPVDLRGWLEHPSSPIRDGNYPSSARPSAPPSGTLQANRTTGVAPLAVQFDDSPTSSTVSNQDFHSLYYLWDYDDASSGTWGTNGKSRDADAGPIGAHVFETVGTYNVGLMVINPTTGLLVSQDTIEITVTDPDTFYSGTNTVCINNVGDSDFTGAPTGALQVNSDSLATVFSTYLADNVRILFKRGGSWSYGTSLINGSAYSSFHIGAYGAGTSPDAQGLFSNAPLFTATGDVNFMSLSRKSDCRVTDIEFTSALTTGEFINGSQDITNNLMMNLKMSGGSSGIEQSNWRVDDTEILSGNFIVNCNISEVNNYNFFAGGDRMCLLGNEFIDTNIDHICRIWQIYKARLSHNKMAGASSVAATGLHALKLHGPEESQVGDFATSGNTGLPNRTQFLVISDNMFGSSPPWPIAIGPQSANNYDERLTDIIVERNLYESDLGTMPSGVDVQQVYKISARYVTVRNNVAFCDAADTVGFTGVAVNRRGTEPTPAYVFAYNNTVCSNDSGSTIVAVELSSDTDDCIATNNLVYAPSATETALSNSGTNNTAATNLSGLTAPLVDPFNATASLRDYSLSVGSGAINTGTDAPVYDDYAGDQRTGTFDVGAYNS